MVHRHASGGPQPQLDREGDAEHAGIGGSPTAFLPNRCASATWGPSPVSSRAVVFTS